MQVKSEELEEKYTKRKEGRSTMRNLTSSEKRILEKYLNKFNELENEEMKIRNDIEYLTKNVVISIFNKKRIQENYDTVNLMRKNWSSVMRNYAQEIASLKAEILKNNIMNLEKIFPFTDVNTILNNIPEDLYINANTVLIPSRFLRNDSCIKKIEIKPMLSKYINYYALPYEGSHKNLGENLREIMTEIAICIHYHVHIEIESPDFTVKIERMYNNRSISEGLIIVKVPKITKIELEKLFNTMSCNYNSYNGFILQIKNSVDKFGNAQFKDYYYPIYKLQRINFSNLSLEQILNIAVDKNSRGEWIMNGEYQHNPYKNKVSKSYFGYDYRNSIFNEGDCIKYNECDFLFKS